MLGLKATERLNTQLAEAMEYLSREEKFHACVYAMNTLLIDKGVYTEQEFARLFIEHANNHRAGRAR